MRLAFRTITATTLAIALVACGNAVSPTYAESTCGSDSGNSPNTFSIVFSDCANVVTLSCDDGVSDSLQIAHACVWSAGPFGAPLIHGTIDPNARCTITAVCEQSFDTTYVQSIDFSWQTDPSNTGCAVPVLPDGSTIVENPPLVVMCTGATIPFGGDGGADSDASDSASDAGASDSSATDAADGD